MTTSVPPPFAVNRTSTSVLTPGGHSPVLHPNTSRLPGSQTDTRPTSD
jgi:hypothetical protein